MNLIWFFDFFYLIDRKYNDIEFKFLFVCKINEILYVFGREGKVWM